MRKTLRNRSIERERDVVALALGNEVELGAVVLDIEGV
jgi:hypothetical protein